jgi:hypothetical protein
VKTRTALAVLLVAAVCGIALFGFLAWRAVTTFETDSTGAEHNFEEAITSVPSPWWQTRTNLHRFGEPKVQHFDGAVTPHIDVRGLQITMDDDRVKTGRSERYRTHFDQQALSGVTCGV